MERKEFIRTCSGLCLASIGSSVLLQACASANYYAKHLETTEIITVNKLEFVGTRKGQPYLRESVLVSTENLPTPICLFKHTDTDYSALLMLCTHQGCELTVAGHMLNCPCHGSDFDNRGVVQNPPADKNLTNYKTTFDEKNIYIHLT